MTTYWTILDAGGVVLQPCCGTPDVLITPDLAGEPWEDGYQAIQIPFAPNLDVHVWNGAAWEPEINRLKVFKREAVNARRAQAENEGCMTPAGIVDSDEKSRGLVSGAVQMAMVAKSFGAPFTETWTMHEGNSTPEVELDADGMIYMGIAVGQYISAVHARGTALKKEIELAATAAALEAIDINTGWPT